MTGEATKWTWTRTVTMNALTTVTMNALTTERIRVNVANGSRR